MKTLNKVVKVNEMTIIDGLKFVKAIADESSRKNFGVLHATETYFPVYVEWNGYKFNPFSMITDIPSVIKKVERADAAFERGEETLWEAAYWYDRYYEWLSKLAAAHKEGTICDPDLFLDMVDTMLEDKKLFKELLSDILGSLIEILEK